MMARQFPFFVFLFLHKLDFVLPMRRRGARRSLIIAWHTDKALALLGLKA
jgi:hypothetical protein